jgi:cobalt-zinc-cadmium efflux system outer membrane protein
MAAKLMKNTAMTSVLLGVLAVAPVMAGCGSLRPLASEGSGSLHALLTPATSSDSKGHATTPEAKSDDSQTLPPRAARFDLARLATVNSEVATPPAARFDLARLAAVNPVVYYGSRIVDGMAPVAEAAPKMSFDQAISMTLTADPKIRAGFEAIVQAKGDLWTASLPPNPTMLLDLLMIPTRSVTPDRTSGPMQTDAFVSYPIDWFLFGKRAAAMASARLGVRQSEWDYADLIRQRIVACASAFYDLVEAKELLKLAHQDVANLQKIEALTEKAIKNGNRSKVDLQRVRLDMLKSEQALREAESTVAVARANLRSLLGRADADPAFDIEADIDAPLNAERIPLEAAYAFARENRPDLRSLQWQVAKADADVVVEDRKRFPEVAPSLGYTRQFQGPALAQIDANTWNMSLTSTLPFCNRNEGNRMKARSVAVQNRFLLASAQVDLRAEVTQVYQQLETAEKNAHAIAQDQKKAAKDVLDAITKSYEAVGGRPYVDVLDAQRNYRDTYRAYISSRANYWREVYRFSAAIGKQITPP